MIVFPMCGQSRRFSEVGYKNPKFMLPLWGGYCFDFAVLGFVNIEIKRPFLFIIPENKIICDFVNARCQKLDIEDFQIITLTEPTSGQADTVAQGINKLGYKDEGDLTVFNIDTFHRNFQFPNQINDWDGYLEVFIGEGNNWSFVEPFNTLSTKVYRTAEKLPISNLCSTGLYYFRHAYYFREAIDFERRLKTETSELYIAPIYNHMIKIGCNVNYHLINSNEVVFCGVPEEYELLNTTKQPSWISNRL